MHALWTAIVNFYFDGGFPADLSLASRAAFLRISVGRLDVVVINNELRMSRQYLASWSSTSII